MRRPHAGPTGATPRPFVVALVLAVLVALALLLVLGGVVLAPLRQAVSDAVSAPLALAATVALARTALRSRGRARRAWGLLATGTGCAAVGEAFWWLARVVPDPDALAGLDDVFYLAWLPFSVVGAASFPAAAWRGQDRLRSVLDGLVVGASLLVVVGAAGLLRPGPGLLREQVVALAYPVGDVVVLVVALAVAVRLPRRAARPLGLTVAALATYAVGDVVYGVLSARGAYVSGTPLDLTWDVAYLLLVLAALAPGEVAEAGTEAPPAYRARVLPWVVVGTAVVGVAAVVLVRPGVLEDRLVALVAALVALLVVVRQAWFVADLGRVNARLRRQAARVERLGDAIVDAILVVDPTGRVAYANDTAVALLGRPRPVLLGSALADLVPHDEGRSAVLELLGTSTSVVQTAAAFVRADGSSVPVDLSVGPIDHDVPEGMILVFRDASAQRELDRLKSEFASVLTHEVRTPLTSIRGALTLLAGGVSGELPPEATRMVRIALESSDRLSRLVNDILDSERLESGFVQLELRAEPAAALVDRAVFEMGGQAASAGVRVVAAEVAGTVRADPDRVVQVLTNLVGNAIKFSPRGAEVRVGATPVGDDVELWVADRGRGIPVAQQRVVFDRYRQVDASDAREAGGTGLGLAICRDIVTLHGGRIWVTSTRGDGAEFRFTLPSAGRWLEPPPRDPAPGRVPAS